MFIAEHCTCLSSLWEELDTMNSLSVVPTPTVDVTKMLKAIDVIKEGSKFFQLYNGLNNNYSAQKSFC